MPRDTQLGGFTTVSSLSFCLELKLRKVREEGLLGACIQSRKQARPEANHAKVSLDYSAQFQKETARCRTRAVLQVYKFICLWKHEKRDQLGLGLEWGNPSRLASDSAHLLPFTCMVSPFTVRTCRRRHQKQVPRKAPVHRASLPIPPSQAPPLPTTAPTTWQLAGQMPDFQQTNSSVPWNESKIDIRFSRPLHTASFCNVLLLGSIWAAFGLHWGCIWARHANVNWNVLSLRCELFGNSSSKTRN